MSNITIYRISIFCHCSYALNNILGQNVDKYLRNPYSARACFKESSNLTKQSKEIYGKRFLYSDFLGNFELEVMLNTMKRKGFNEYKVWNFSQKQPKEEFRYLFNLNDTFNSLERPNYCDNKSRCSRVIGYFISNVDEEAGHWTCLTRNPELNKWVFVDSINKFLPRDDLERIVEGLEKLKNLKEVYPAAKQPVIYKDEINEELSAQEEK